MAAFVNVGRAMTRAFGAWCDSETVWRWGQTAGKSTTGGRGGGEKDRSFLLTYLWKKLRLSLRKKATKMELLFSAVIGIILLATFLRRQFPWLRYELRLFKVLGTALVKVLNYERKKMRMVDLFEEKVSQHPQKPFVIYQDNIYSYEFMNQQMNKVANVGLNLGLRQGEVIALLMQNEPAFIWTFYGMSKLGVEPAFLNFNLRSTSLLHCFKVSGSKILIVGQSPNDELLEAVKEIYHDLEKLNVTVYVQGHGDGFIVPYGYKSFDDMMTKASDANVPKSLRSKITPKTPLCYIYTSGTTGLPKAAVVSHNKSLKGALLMPMIGVSASDVIYTPLPLYHSAACLIALGTTVETGATLVLRIKFSASQFWEDCRKHNVTVIQYIGELCRYLIAQPPKPDDRNHMVRAAFGNGLRTDIWREFQERFNVPIIGEFYAATEGNAGFINVYNKFGSVGRMSPLMNPVYPVYFIKYDLIKDEPVRDSKGCCIHAEAGEAGLMISKIKRNFEFDGYKGNTELTQKKILTDVFTQGDKYFNTGDLLTYDKDYFVYFTDRIGDTFRWKGENVSTIEVSNVVADPEWIEDANVYGVTIPGQDGRAGMAAITLTKGDTLNEKKLNSLYKHCEELLPTYARPRFLRFQEELEVTGTFKQRKVELVKDGFDPDNMGNDPVYVMDPAKQAYVQLDKVTHQAVLDGKIRL